jgi:hypothetical protein
LPNAISGALLVPAIDGMRQHTSESYRSPTADSSGGWPIQALIWLEWGGWMALSARPAAANSPTQRKER